MTLKMEPSTHIKFYVGETLHAVAPEDVTPETTLNQYLREKVHLTGTKLMCLEGGCGACIVAIEFLNPTDRKRKILAVNSCLVSIFSCHGWKIHTIEGLGGPKIGYHPLQTLLAKENGSQCGFCSGGMIMNMFALKESGKKFTAKQIENSFAGNICRCTGYRPILQAFKSLASDDIEDYKPCNREKCETECRKNCEKTLIYKADKTRWIKIYDLQDLLETLATVEKSYILVAGNTARGVYKKELIPNTYLDISSVKELTTYKLVGNTLELGANISLTNTMEIFYNISKQNPNFAYLSKMADHIDLIAHIPVRNIGTLAGNLMIKNLHNEFPSDIFLILETVEAVLTIIDTDEKETKISPQHFMKFTMNRKVLKSITLKGYDSNYFYTSYKIMPRAQNAHALVNAGFLLNIKNNIVRSATIVYGGINPQFVHATNTEKFLTTKNLFDNNTLQLAFKTLSQEIKSDWVLPDTKPEFRKGLAISLFYKYVLSISPPQSVSARNKSGGLLMERPVSSGKQEFSSNEKKYPLTKPMVKLEALAQTSGQAKYLEDTPDFPDQLYAQFVTAKAVANSVITNINTDKALKLAGVVVFFGKNDIPGRNTWTPLEAGFVIEESLFCEGTVQYFEQPVGIILAESQELAIKAAELVVVETTPPKQQPLLNIRDVLNAPKDVQKVRIKHQTTVVPKGKGKDTKTVVKGEFYIGMQYHYHMEVQCCNVVPTDDGGINMYPASQWMDCSQIGAATVLGISHTKVNIKVRRLGGGFGAKIMRNTLVSTAASLAAYKLKRPVKMRLPLERNMEIIGKRYPLYMKYEAGVNTKGIIQYLNADLYSDFGVGGNEYINPLLISMFENGYVIDNWSFSSYVVNTDTHANCSTRGPGTCEGLSAIDSIMEHIASTINMDALELKMANWDKTNFTKMVDFSIELPKWADISNRKKAIEKFNSENRWKKRGMAIVPMGWTLEIPASYISLVSIFHADGSVAIAHAGIEIGQGINTKVAQVAAYKLGISMDLISIKPSNTLCNPNATYTGGSLTSEAVCYATLRACDILLERMKPVRDKMSNPTWPALVKASYDQFVQLSASSMFSPKEPNIQKYVIYGLGAAEVEVDILTGQYMLSRVDILEDVGDSMNPIIDIGQVEGAFVMGTGYHTTEEIIYNKIGQILTNRTWNYKPPGAKDIPVDFRIKFPSNNPNNVGVLNSKARAEPPLCLSVSVPLAIRNAVGSARQDADKSKPRWYQFDGCSSVENTFLNSLNDYTQYTL